MAVQISKHSLGGACRRYSLATTASTRHRRLRNGFTDVADNMFVTSTIGGTTGERSAGFADVPSNAIAALASRRLRFDSCRLGTPKNMYKKHTYKSMRGSNPDIATEVRLILPGGHP